MNLVCADIVLGEGSELEELLARFENDPLTQELIETIWQGLQNARELGSLLKVEEQIDAVIARKREAEKGTFWEHPEDLWEQWKQDFLETLKAYVDRAAEAFDVNRRMFGQEAIKGVQLLDLLTARYNVVTTNPPYMGRGKMSDTLKELLSQSYPRNKRDLYAAFVERCLLSSEARGVVAMITQHSFMFLKAFRKLRHTLLNTAQIRCLAHLGPGAFEAIGGEVVNTAMFCLNGEQRPEQVSVFFRLIDVDKKGENLIELVDKHRRLCDEGGDDAGDIHLVKQNEFSFIDGSPFGYWSASEVRELFRRCPRLENFAEIKLGLSAVNNSRFLRYFWEVPPDRVGRKWFLMMKGGPFSRWYGNNQYVVNWAEDGAEMKATVVEKYPYLDGNYGWKIRDEEYYFRTGITYTNLSSSGFCVRRMPDGALFEDTGPVIFPQRYSRDFWLGVLNTKLVSYVLDLLNPTLHYQAGDVARVPVAEPEPRRETEIGESAKRCVAIKKELLSFQMTEWNFKTTGLEWGASEADAPELLSVYERFLAHRESLRVSLLMQEGFLEKEAHELYDLSPRTRDIIFRQQGSPAGFLGTPYAGEPVLDGLDATTREYLSELVLPTSIELTEELKARGNKTPASRHLPPSAVVDLYVSEGHSLRQISLKLGMNPIGVLGVRREMGLINPDDLQHEVENVLTHRIWELCKQDEDGIIPYADGLRNPPLLDQVRGEIESVFGAENAVSIEAEMDEILGRGGLIHWLENPFFRKHKGQFRRRPILWHITSPDKHFRVLVYYHKLDRDTLPKVRSQYLWPQLERARARLRAVKAQDPPDVKTIGELEEVIADLEECDRRLEHVIRGDVDVDLPDWAVGPYRNGTAPYDPDLDDGVKVNILPLQAAEMLPYKRVV
ncbi:MAG: N-6 DNA methylase [Desulfobacterales bacterium]